MYKRQELASLADAYVDDAFGSCHRAHCSTAGVTEFIKDTAVGYLMAVSYTHLDVYKRQGLLHLLCGKGDGVFVVVSGTVGAAVH